MTARNAPFKRLSLFETAWLERLTVFPVHWFAIVWSVLLCLVAVVGWGAVSPLEGLALVVAGLIAWSLFEYAVHRYLFHMKSRWRVINWLVFVLHGNHHAQPRDPLRNLMPPLLSVPIALCIWAAIIGVAGTAGTWAFMGFMIGYVIYDLVHYACHQWPMRRGVLRALKRHHMRHHYFDADANYAITGLHWDRVFGSRTDSLKR